MKIRDTLVVTLCDFSKLIDFPTFWYKRRRFVRDLNPQRCYYWTDNQKLLFDVIKRWIDIEDSVISENEWIFSIEENIAIIGFSDHSNVQLNLPYNEEYSKSLKMIVKDNFCRYIGIIALSELVGRQMDLKEVRTVYDVASDSETPIIEVLAGTPLYCKGLSPANAEDSYRIRKIEAIGEGQSPVEIYIDNVKQKSLNVGECAYAVCKGDGFIKILPSKMDNEYFSMTLCSRHGEYASSLEVEDDNQKIETYTNVTSFAFDNAGYPVFTTADGELCILDSGNFTLKQQLKGFNNNYPDTPIIAIEEKNGYYKFYTCKLIYG